MQKKLLLCLTCAAMIGVLPVAGTTAQAAVVTYDVAEGVTETQATPVAGGDSVLKKGLGTLIIDAANTYTGSTEIQGGTLELNGATGSLSPLSAFRIGNSNVGGNAFIYDNVGATGATSQTMASLWSQSGRTSDSTVQITRTEARPVSLTFTAVNYSGNESGNFINFVTEDTAGGGVNGTDYKIVLADHTGQKIVNQRTYFNGGDFAVYDISGGTGLDGFVRGINYGVDSDSATSAGGAFFWQAGDPTISNQEITGAITAQPSVTLKRTVQNGSLKIDGAHDITMLPGDTLTIEGQGNQGSSGILKTGGGTSTISGDSNLWLQQTQWTIRVDGETDVLNIDMPIRTSSTQRMAKTGEGTLILSKGTFDSSDHRNPMYLNGGVLEAGGSFSYNLRKAPLKTATGTVFRYSSSATSVMHTIAGGITGYGAVEVTNGTLILAGNNTYTGNTAITGGGTLQVGNGGTTGSISSSSAIANDGALVFNVAGTTTLTSPISGSGSVTVNQGLLQLSPSDTNTMVVSTIASGGGLVNFTPGTGIIQTTTGDASGLIGAWATYNSNDWAVGSSDGTLATVTAATYTNTSDALDDPANYAGNNMNVDSSQTPTGAIAPNTLRFNTAAAHTLTLRGANTIAGGGILVGTGVGNNLSKITGGTLATGTELSIAQSNPAGSLEIGSAITGGGIVTKLGAGTLVLSGTSDYSGGTQVLAGALQVSADANLGAAGTAVTLDGGGQLDGGTATVTLARPITLNSGGGVFTNAAGGNMTVTGTITGTGPLSLAPGGDLTVAGAINSTGPVSVSASGAAGSRTTKLGNTGTTTIGGVLTVGPRYSDGASLLIEGYTLSTPAGTNIGDNSSNNNNSNNSVTVNGSSAVWNTGALNVGRGGTNDGLTVSAGGKVNVTGNVVVAPYNKNSGDHYVTVTGAGSELAATDSFTISRMPDSSLTISDGGTVRASSYGQSDVINCGVTIDGPNSLLALTGYVRSRSKQAGASTSHYINITNGGAMESTSGYVGYNHSSGINGTITVDGSGSTWTNTGGIFVQGNAGNILTVSNYGQVAGSISLSVGDGSGTSYQNSIVLVQTNSLLQAGASMTVGRADSTNNTVTAETGGILQFTSATPAITIGTGAGNAVNINGGTLSYKGATGVDMNANAAADGVGLFTWTGNNTLRLDNSFSTDDYTFAATADPKKYSGLDLKGGTASGTITVAGTGTLSGTGTIGTLDMQTGSTCEWGFSDENLPAGTGWDLIGVSGDLTLGNALNPAQKWIFDVVDMGGVPSLSDQYKVFDFGGTLAAANDGGTPAKLTGVTITNSGGVYNVAGAALYIDDGGTSIYLKGLRGLTSALQWDGGSGNWATANWDGGLPSPGTEMIIDGAGSDVTVTTAASTYMPAGPVDVTNAASLAVASGATLTVNGDVTVDTDSTLTVDGTLNADAGTVAGTLAGNGTINLDPMVVTGTAAPGGVGAAGALTVAPGSELALDAGTYNAEVILSDLTNLTADQIVNTKVGNDQATLIITGGTLAPKGVGRSDSASFTPITSLVVVDNTQGGILEGVLDDERRKFGAVDPVPAAGASAHVGQGAFLRGVTYEGNPSTTEEVKLVVVVALEGDVDGDGLIGLDDWDAFRSNFGSSETDWTQGNFDPWSDVTVDLDDWDRFRSRFGQAYPIDVAASAAAAVPEPGTIAMLLGALGGLALLIRRRRCL